MDSDKIISIETAGNLRFTPKISAVEAWNQGSGSCRAIKTSSSSISGLRKNSDRYYAKIIQFPTVNQSAPTEQVQSPVVETGQVAEVVQPVVDQVPVQAEVQAPVVETGQVAEAVQPVTEQVPVQAEVQAPVAVTAPIAEAVQPVAEQAPVQAEVQAPIVETGQVAEAVQPVVEQVPVQAEVQAPVVEGGQVVQEGSPAPEGEQVQTESPEQVQEETPVEQAEVVPMEEQVDAEGNFLNDKRLIKPSDSEVDAILAALDAGEKAANAAREKKEREEAAAKEAEEANRIETEKREMAEAENNKTRADLELSQNNNAISKEAYDSAKGNGEAIAKILAAYAQQKDIEANELNRKTQEYNGDTVKQVEMTNSFIEETAKNKEEITALDKESMENNEKSNLLNERMKDLKGFGFDLDAATATYREAMLARNANNNEEQENSNEEDAAYQKAA